MVEKEVKSSPELSVLIKLWKLKRFTLHQHLHCTCTHMLWYNIHVMSTCT